MTMQLEHPAVLEERRRLNGHIERGEIRRYSNLRWSARDGVSYAFQPVKPLNFIKYTFDVDVSKLSQSEMEEVMRDALEEA